ncbi:MAG TPA: amidohydrolase family protein [Pirellulales bacterium]|nr:amidohydrolase family protein [Pirellulales bacterium]
MHEYEKPVTVDAHQHFWDLGRFSYPWMTANMQTVRRNFLPADLRPVLNRVGVDRTVFVQSLHSLEETEWALQLATENPWIAGVVGWLDLKSPDLERHIDRFSDQVKLVGVRHIVHDESDERWLLDECVVRGLKVLARCGLKYDLLLRPQHLKYIPQLAHRVPGLQMVVDHLAKPLIGRGEFEPWQTDLAAVARVPDIYCKLSGMITEADHQRWSAEELFPYVDIVLDLFGPQRLMFGSDWPMCRLAGEYSEVLAAAHQALWSLSADERSDIFGKTASRFYRLQLSSNR